MALLRSLLVAVLVLAGTPAPAAVGAGFNARDIGAERRGGDFHLTDHNGRVRSLADFRGSVVLIYFGYTRCPDFCPTTLAHLAAVMKRLGADASRVQVLFVSVDPQRDGETLLRHYVPAFHPAFLGLRGTEEETREAAAAFGASYRILDYQGETLVDHSTSGYLVDPRGRTRLLLPHAMTADQIAADVRTILAESAVTP